VKWILTYIIWSRKIKVEEYTYADAVVQTLNTNNPYAYTGRELDDTDLYYYRARYYDPSTQRFLGEDPIGYNSGDFNFYRYVGNSPVNYVDPMGLYWLNDLANFSAGFGDALTFGLTAEFRETYGYGDVVDKCSGLYSAGEYSTFLIPVGAAGNIYRTGMEFKIGKNFRFAPLGNRTGHPTGKYPHYHRRPTPNAKGQVPRGQGMKRHRPWDKSPDDNNFRSRF